AGAAGQDQVARAATIRRTEFVTPLTTGRKHSETIATRTRRAWGHHRSTARRRGDGARNACRTLDRLRRRVRPGAATAVGRRRPPAYAWEGRRCWRGPGLQRRIPAAERVLAVGRDSTDQVSVGRTSAVHRALSRMRPVSSPVASERATLGRRQA